MSLSSDHPRLTFLFFLREPADEGSRTAVASLVHELRGRRRWLLGPPAFVDEVGAEANEDGSLIETVGGALEVYSTLRGLTIPERLDEQQLEEVETIVAAVADLSGREGLDFDFELGLAPVGSVESGMLDHSLREVLINEWRKSLNERRQKS